MSQRSFGTGGTLKKLSTVADYLHFYTTALAGKHFRLTYFDAFAGSGEIPMKEQLPLLVEAADLADVTEGSARRALGTTPPFDRYVFIDGKKANAVSLEGLRLEFPTLGDHIEVQHNDANDAIVGFCRAHGRFDRTVMFLDPFGNQVRWESIEIIAETPGIDLWYLFPAGLGVMRQISKDGTIHPDAAPSLDLLFGTPDWRNHLISRSQRSDLFGSTEGAERVGSADLVTRYMIERMKGIFEGRVLDSWLPVGPGKAHWFSLIVAWSNPSPKATDLVRRVGHDIMRRR